MLASTFGAKAQPPTPEKGFKWELVKELSDEFDGTTLNSEKWSNADPNRWRGRAPGLFLAKAVSVKDGKMRITADELGEPVVLYGRTFTHQGGHVYSKGLVKPGSYIECRMKANKTFMSSTFWLNNYTDETTGCQSRVTELDIQECIGYPEDHAKTTQMGSNTHSRGIPKECSHIPAGSAGNHCETPGKVYDHFFTYAVWWKSPTELLFYLNGEYKYTITPKADFDIETRIKMVVETYNWSPVPEDGGMTGTWEERTTYYDWVRTYEYLPVN
ncbi:glycoside hydrolase [Bacteroidota bacterium]